jgi:hypothetical protein
LCLGFRVWGLHSAQQQHLSFPEPYPPLFFVHLFWHL